MHARKDGEIEFPTIPSPIAPESSSDPTADALRTLQILRLRAQMPGGGSFIPEDGLRAAEEAVRTQTPMPLPPEFEWLRDAVASSQAANSQKER